MGALTGRVVLITGAGRGIGREEALLCASEGAKVVVNDPGVAPDGSGADESVATAVVDEIVARGGEAVANTDSVSDWEGARRMVQTAVDAFGDLHAVVANATVKADRAMVTMTEDQFDDVIAVKLKGTFAVSRWAARHWRERYEAGVRADRAIITTSSGSGLVNPLPAQTNYAAANAGVAAMTISAALELSRYGIRVNCVSPSMARTRLTLGVPGMSSPAPDGFDPSHPRASAPVVGYLASAGCPLTGQVLAVRGGTVTINNGWSPGEYVHKEVAPWTIGDLGAALTALSFPDQFEKLGHALGGALGAAGRDRIRQMIDEVLDAASS